MKVKNVSNGDLLGVNARAVASKQSVEVAHESGVQRSQVDLGAVKRIQESVSSQELLAERAQRLAEIRKQVQSGEYFKTRSVSKVAKVLEERLGEEIDLQRLFNAVGDSE